MFEHNDEGQNDEVPCLPLLTQQERQENNPVLDGAADCLSCNHTVGTFTCDAA